MAVTPPTGAAPRVELLLVPDCPHGDSTRAMLTHTLQDLGLDVEVIERIGEHASPTVLVDGLDVMTGTAPGGTASCRLDLPTPERLRQAIGDNASDDDDAGWYPPELAVGVTSDRITFVSPAARAVHKTILNWFATYGHAPFRSELAAAAQPGHDLGELLAELHDRDVIRLADNGNIRAAYPFSAVPTAHAVAIDGGPAVFAMCAVDALGMAAMLGRDITIGSRDPRAGQAITVTIHNGHTSWVPTTTVVFVGAQATDLQNCCPAEGTTRAVAADICCHVMNFFAGTASAHAWWQANPTVSGHILSQRQALRLGNDIFGRLLRD